ncbi:hypothetical protein B0H11DRAFT_2245121 [Mycena galericulata]|nr:hypothetical protein B0H11DRAFT_2245121 [Mycena galericulata]
MSPTPTTAPIHEVLGTAEADLAAAQRGQHNPDDQVFIEAEYYARAGVPPHQQNSSGRRDALPVPPQKLPAATARVRCLHSNCGCEPGVGYRESRQTSNTLVDVRRLQHWGIYAIRTAPRRSLADVEPWQRKEATAGSSRCLLLNVLAYENVRMWHARRPPGTHLSRLSRHSDWWHLDVPLQTLSPGSGKRPPPAQAVVCRSTFSLMRTSACGTHADHLAPTCLDFRAIRTGGCLSSTLFISARVLTASDQHLGVLLMRICDTPWCSTPLRVANLIRCALLTHWIIADLLPPECVQSLRANEIWAIIKTFGYCWGSRTNSTNSKKRHRPLEQNSRDLQASGYIQEVMFSHSEEKLWVCRQSPIVSRLPSLNATIGGISGSETVLEDVDFGPTRTALTVRTLFAEFYRQPTLPLK